MDQTSEQGAEQSRKPGAGPATAEASTREASTQADAITWFRNASPYIDAHRGRTIVLALPGAMLRSDVLPTLTHDLSLLVHLGLRVVLCFGLRAQMDEQLADASSGSRIVDGRRVTDDAALQAILTAAGLARTDLEARLSMGLPNTPMAGAPLTVSSGNFLVARPFGIHDGVDYRHTGTVREVRTGAIAPLLDAGHLVLLPPLGHSLTGDVFNLPVDEVAACVAVALEAHKLVYFIDDLPCDASGKPVRQSSATALETLLAGAPDEQLVRLAGRVAHACRAGVERVHLLENDDPDALLRELFSRDGSGTMVTARRWEHIRDASIEDVGGIIELVAPLQENGALAARSREQLELDIEHFVVSERDGTIIACAALFGSGQAAEIACVATHADYQGEGRADALVSLLEERARDQGARQVLLLSTRAGHWFVERGYAETTPDALPAERRARYNRQRNSRVYAKAL